MGENNLNMFDKFNFSKMQPFLKKGRFYNSKNEIGNNIFSEYALMMHSGFHELAIFFKSFLNYEKRNNLASWIEQSNIMPHSTEPSITWIGHATFLIQINNFNVLTDPIFGNATFLFPRILPPGIILEKLPKIDFVLISHNHRDHMDEMSLVNLKKLNPYLKFLVPQGDKDWFLKKGFNCNDVQENLWWNQLNFKNNDHSEIRFTFLPSKHWSQRSLFDYNKSLWGSWMVESGFSSIYFAGDTAYSQHFNEISNEFKNIDIALMPIGPCEPRKKMCNSHVSAEESGQAFLDLNAKNFVPMHWGTFKFGTDKFALPIERIKKWWNMNSTKLNFKNLNLIKIGQKIEFKYAELSKQVIGISTQQV